MLAVFFGNDVINVRRSAHDFSLIKKGEGALIETIDPQSFRPGYFKAAVASDSLFGDCTVYLVDMPSENKEMYEELIGSLDELAVSANTFIIMEGPLLAAEKKKFERAAEVFEEHKREASQRFNNFSLADALAKKDKKLLWLLLAEARLEGISDEEIVGVLWWQLKTLRLAMLTSSAAEAGLKDFPYSKAKRALSKFAPGELETLSQKLLALLHESRQGKGELDISLERFVLEI